MTDNRLAFTIYKEELQVNTKKTHYKYKKWAEDLNRPFIKDGKIANKHMKRSQNH